MRGEQPGRDGSTLVVNRPHFDPSAVSSLNNGVRPPATRQIVPRPIINRNGNNPAPRARNPRQNNFSAAERNQNLNTPPTPSSEPGATPAHDAARAATDPRHCSCANPVAASRQLFTARARRSSPNYDPDKRIYSPRQQQVQQQTPPRDIMRVNAGTTAGRASGWKQLSATRSLLRATEQRGRARIIRTPRRPLPATTPRPARKDPAADSRIKAAREIDFAITTTARRRDGKISARRFCFCNFAAAGKVSAWEFPCGNSSR